MVCCRGLVATEQSNSTFLGHVQVILARERFGRKGLVAVKIPEEGAFGNADGFHKILLREIMLI